MQPRLSSLAAAPQVRERWHLIYYVLASFDLLTIIGSLILCSSLVGIFNGSVDVHNGWMTRFDGYERLSEAIARVDDPGNQVFETHDIEGESRKLDEHLAEFHRAHREMVEDTGTLASELQRGVLVADLKSVYTGVQAMEQTSRSIFVHLRKGDHRHAASLSARMDHTYASLNRNLSLLRKHVWEFEKHDLHEQRLRAQAYIGIERWFAAVVLVIVGLVIWYGRVMSRRVMEARRLIEQQRLQMLANYRLSALGEMAGGVAHEINNPLAIIKARAEMLREQAESGACDLAEVVETTTTIERTCARIAKIIKGLRTFSRSGDGDPARPESVRRIVDETLELCREKLRSQQIDLRVSLPTADLVMNCRATEISQVLLNLVSNAKDAVADSAEKWIAIEGRELHDAIEISVTDSGPGVPVAIRDKIMQPFFTTKEIGDGTGLGLSISSGIARGHFGSLRLDVEAKHTHFVLRIPKTTPSPESMRNVA